MKPASFAPSVFALLAPLVFGCSPDKVGASVAIDGCYGVDSQDVLELRNGSIIDAATNQSIATFQREVDQDVTHLNLSKTIEVGSAGAAPSLRIVSNEPMYLLMLVRSGGLVIPVPKAEPSLELTLLTRRTEGSCR